MKLKITVLITFLFFIVNVSYTCTIIKISNKNIVLAGNNEDWIFPFTKVWFIPADNGEFGRVTFGFDELGYRPEGGMNTEGLFVDVNGTNNPGWRPIKGLDDFNGNQDYILANCSTVDEVLDLFKDKNCPRLAYGKIMVVDATGKSAIIEYGKNKVEFIINNEGYQISTNFFQSHYEGEDYPDKRYNVADAILKDKKEYSIDLMRTVLSATSFEHESRSITQYSYICDLLNGKIYLYHFHDFERTIVFDVKQELAKGKHELEIQSLFLPNSFAYEMFLQRSPHALFINAMKTMGIESAILGYEYAKMVSVGAPIQITESEFNMLGYRLRQDNRLQDAIKLFEFIAKEYPKSSNAYDSLAEAYMKNGQKDLAIINYKKSLELNPDNENAKEMLKELKEINR